MLKNEITQNINSQVGFGANRNYAVLLGKKNAEYFYHINKEYNFFKEFVVLGHPRYIMQYKLKQMDNYLNKYLKAIR